MYLIAGLGNPGSEYEHTRHNTGFDAIDFISRRYNIPINRTKFKGLIGEGNMFSTKVMLLKPLTYMNLSGDSVRETASFYKVEPKNIIVIHDDIDLDIGKIRIRPKGSAGGHNGIKSIIANLNSEEFIRVRIGVGYPKNDLVKFVLDKFSDQDRKIIDKVFETASDAVDTIIKDGVLIAMNKYNGLKIV